MHPGIKIVNLILFSIFLTQGNWLTLLIMGALLLPFYLSIKNIWQSALQMLVRLKWLFLSILLIYYFYTPNLSHSSSFVFTAELERLMPGLFRISILLTILFSVNLFLKSTTKEEILAALMWLFFPLAKININIERISLRAILTIEYIEQLSERLKSYKEQQRMILDKDDMDSFLLKKKKAFLHLIKHSGIILQETLKEAESTSGKLYSIELLSPPALIQFLFPLVIGLLFYLSLFFR